MKIDDMPEVIQARRALTCIFLEMPACICEDVRSKVEGPPPDCGGKFCD